MKWKKEKMVDQSWINQLIDAAPLIQQLCEEEGAVVTLTGSNPDWNGLPNQVVIVCNRKTNWDEKSFFGDTIKQCLEKAIYGKVLEPIDPTEFKNEVVFTHSYNCDCSRCWLGITDNNNPSRLKIFINRLWRFKFFRLK